MEKLKNKILAELRYRSLGSGNIWLFSNWNGFRNNLNPIEKNWFPQVMSKLVEDGLLLEEQYGSVVQYRITDKGEQVIYQKV